MALTVPRNGRKAGFVVVFGDYQALPLDERMVSGYLKVSPDKFDQSRERARDMVDATRREEGCIEYVFA